jgi:hypothetical protein
LAAQFSSVIALRTLSQKVGAYSVARANAPAVTIGARCAHEAAKWLLTIPGDSLLFNDSIFVRPH